MKVTVKEILTLESFHDVEVMAGFKGMNKEVENAYVMEVPDISAYVSEGGLLFTTLYPIINNEQAMTHFITDLKAQGLAGVAIKVGRYIDDIPDYMIRQGEAHDFAVLKLPSNANFSILTNDILTRLLGMKTKELEFRESISAKLHTLLLSGADIKDLVSYVSVITEKDIIVVSQQLKYIDSSIDSELTHFTIHEPAFKKLNDDFSSRVEETSLVEINHDTYRYDELIIHPIDAGNKILGYIILLDKESNQKDKTEYLNVIIEQAVILLAFLLQNRQALLQKERNYLDNFIRDMINHQYSSQSELIQKAKVFKWNLHFPNIIMLIDLEERSPDKRLSNYYHILDSGVITEELSRQLEISKDNCKVALYNNHIICFVSVALITNLTTKLNKAGESILNRLKKFSLLRVSFSNVFYASNEIKNAYEEAALVQTIYKDVDSTHHFVKFYANLGTYKLFHLIENKDPLHQFVDEKLGLVLVNDQKNEMELIKTLQTLIKNNLNLKKTAGDLFIHYNSLRYRVSKLKELGVKLDDGNEMTEIAVACQLLTYLNETQ
ncbi:MAG: PucR family transcriptional regulator ligand-binding domain-containing protein [Alkalibacterium sp.]|nr:PucR family transcriptional regulator ligand-binding domain-containing protein [Alkalibacterium sp.]